MDGYSPERGAARRGVQAYLQPPAVFGLNYVYSTFVHVIPSEAFTNGQPAGTASGAVGAVDIIRDEEVRIAIGGQKLLTFSMAVHIFHRSSEPDSQAAADHFDWVVDSLRARLRGPADQPADHTLGGVFWDAASGRITGEYGEPVLNGEITESWAQILFDATVALAPQA